MNKTRSSKVSKHSTNQDLFVPIDQRIIIEAENLDDIPCYLDQVFEFVSACFSDEESKINTNGVMMTMSSLENYQEVSRDTLNVIHLKYYLLNHVESLQKYKQPEQICLFLRPELENQEKETNEKNCESLMDQITIEGIPVNDDFLLHKLFSKTSKLYMSIDLSKVNLCITYNINDQDQIMKIDTFSC